MKQMLVKRLGDEAPLWQGTFEDAHAEAIYKGFLWPAPGGQVALPLGANGTMVLGGEVASKCILISAELQEPQPPQEDPRIAELQAKLAESQEHVRELQRGPAGDAG